jgi:hypothetical protein
MKAIYPLKFGFFRNWKSVLVLLSVISKLFADNIFAVEIPLDELGYQFYSKTLEVEWKLPTSRLPAAVRTFKVVPATFSPAIISNLVSWGGFTETNRIWFSEDGKRIPSDTLVFRKNDNRQWLTIDPTSGQAHLYNPILSRVMPEDVPDKPRAYLLATNILRRLGISTNELILEDAKPEAWFYEGETTTNPKGSEPITRRSHMGVEFRRQLDGIPCVWEHIHIDFETHEQITQFEIEWRGLKPSKPYPVATPKQMTAWIKEGRARVQSLEGPIGARWMNTADIKRISIVGSTLRYTTATHFIDSEEKQVDRLYPYAVLQADAEIAPDDHETIWLFSPIIAEGLNKPSQAATNDIGFSVYPSNLREKQRKQTDTP